MAFVTVTLMVALLFAGLQAGYITHHIENDYDYLIYVDGATVYAISGATGNIYTSSTNASAVFNTVITGLSSGGSIAVKNGLYLITTSIFLTQNITIRGEGIETIFDAETTCFRDASNIEYNNYVTLDNFVIDLDTAVTASVGVYVGRGDYWTITRVTVHDLGDALIDTNTGGISTGSWAGVGITTTYLTIGHCFFEGISETKNFVPLTITHAEQILIYSSSFIGRGASVAVNASKGPTCTLRDIHHVKFLDCTFERGHHNGVNFNDGTAVGFSSHDVLFDSCSFIDNGDDALDPNYDSEINIFNCFFENTQNYMISFEDWCTDSTVSNCIQALNGSRGVNINNSSDILVVNNIIQRSDSQFWGVHIVDSARVTVRGNTLGDYLSAAITIEGSTFIIVDGNRIVVGGYNYWGIYIDDSTYCTITNNVISRGVTSQKIRVILELGTSDYNVITNNVMEYVHHWSTYQFVGSHTKIRRNTSFDFIQMRDYDGTMTGATNTLFTYEAQYGEEESLEIDAVSIVQTTVIFEYQYPSGGATNGGPPTVLVTLKDPTHNDWVGVLSVGAVTVTGFNITLVVTQASATGGATVDVAWCASLPETW